MHTYTYIITYVYIYIYICVCIIDKDNASAVTVWIRPSHIVHVQPKLAASRGYFFQSICRFHSLHSLAWRPCQSTSKHWQFHCSSGVGRVGHVQWSFLEVLDPGGEHETFHLTAQCQDLGVERWQARNSWMITHFAPNLVETWIWAGTRWTWAGKLHDLFSDWCLLVCVTVRGGDQASSKHPWNPCSWNGQIKTHAKTSGHWRQCNQFC